MRTMKSASLARAVVLMVLFPLTFLGSCGWRVPRAQVSNHRGRPSDPTRRSQNLDATDAAAAPEFPSGLRWLNTDRPATLEQLRGKIVVLDFWTYA